MFHEALFGDGIEAEADQCRHTGKHDKSSAVESPQETDSLVVLPFAHTILKLTNLSAVKDFPDADDSKVFV